LSRCLQFHLRALLPQQIVERLKLILETEQIPFDDKALQLLARAATGSMRDGLSLLDQAIAHGAGEVRETSVQSMLGLIESRFIVQLLQALAAGDAGCLLDVAASFAERAADYTEVLDSLLRYLYQLSLLQILPSLSGDDPTIDPELPKLIDVLPREDVQLYYQIALLGKRDMPLAPDPRTGFEMCLLRMLAFQPVVSDDNDRSAKNLRSEVGRVSMPATRLPVPDNAPEAVAKQQISAGTQNTVSSVETANLSGVETQVDARPDMATVVPIQQVSTNTAMDSGQWSQLVAGLELQGVARELARNCVLTRQDTKKMMIAMPESMRNLATPERIHALAEAFGQYFDRELNLEVEFRTDLQDESPADRERRLARERQNQSEEAVARHPVVEQLRKDFSAVVVPGSTHPVNALPVTKDSGEQI